MQGLSSGCSQDIGRVRSHLKACLELEDPISRRLPHKVVGQDPQFLIWLLAGGLRSLLYEPPHKLLEYPDDVATNSPQNELSKRKQ